MALKSDPMGHSMLPTSVGTWWKVSKQPQLFLLSRFWINYIIWFLSYKKAVPWDWMLQFFSFKYLLTQQSQKRLSKKSCGYYNMVHQWPMEVGSIKSPMGSAFRASIGHSTTWCILHLSHESQLQCMVISNYVWLREGHFLVLWDWFSFKFTVK